ncbi:MAG TPA: efflux RND transporter periplasmic adaptor subunit [Gemmatimonadaceae bacterium]|nr:efflux RND transporter periplasmic adaptor subunit [Gemmatimonadaceae bacterium]
MMPRLAQTRLPTALLGLALLAACGKKEQNQVAIQTAPVERRNITVTAEATGTVEPINIVEVKSKASGQITRMPVDVGSKVSAGQLLVQIDTRDVRNNYDQAVAQLRAAQANLQVATAQKTRSDELFKQEVITPQEHETATLTFANAQAQVVKARTDADLARQRLEDATVRAPVAGTVIAKPVSLGQVITSATSGPTGGTTILQMADLNKVRMRALVNETDVGNVKPGQVASVTVDAFPDRRFQGVVEKVEPQAVVQQSVTMFPVLISLENREGTLLPGMNGQVSMTVAQKNNVLAVPADAVRAMKDLAVSARALGLDPDSAQAKLRASFAARGGRTRDSAAGEVATNGGQGPGARTQGPADSGRVAQNGRGGRRGQGMGGTGGVPAAPNANGDQPPQLQFGAGSGTTRSNAQLVFVKDSNGFAPRMVRLGVTNYDYTEVLGGLREGDEVALLASATLQQQRQDQNARFRNATAGPLSPGGGGGGGGARGGGGGRP